MTAKRKQPKKRHRSASPGHIRRRARNSYSVVVYLGQVDGKARHKWYTVQGDREAAEQFLRDRLTELHRGTYVEPTPAVLADFAAAWLRDYARPNLRPTTYNNYEVSLRLHALPLIGDRLLQQLTAPDIQQVLTACHDKGLAPKTVKHVHTALRRLLNQAVRWRLLAHNPATDVDPPRQVRPRVQAWTAAEAQKFLLAAKGHRLFALFWLALHTGMRRGELLALEWKDVDWRGQIAVRQAFVPGKRSKPGDTKTPASVRVVALSPDTLTILRVHQALQEEEDLGDCPFVFASTNGNRADPSGIYRTLTALCRKAGVKRIRLHDLRHTCASLLLEAGAHPKVVQERLGHVDVATTLNVYSHLQPNIQREAARTLDSLLAVSSLLAEGGGGREGASSEPGS